MKKYLTKFGLIAVSLYQSVHVAHAEISSGGFIFENPISRGSNIYAFVNSIMDFVIKIGTVVVIFMVIYSGFLFVKAQGDSGAISEAKDTFFWTVIGGVVLIGAKVLATVICNTAVGLGAAIQCGLI